MVKLIKTVVRVLSFMPPFFKNQKSKNKLQPQADQTNSEQAASSLRNLLSENLNLIKEKTGKDQTL